MTQWLSASDADLISEIWPDVPGYLDGAFVSNALELVLGAAQEQCEEYAPALDENEPVPARYQLALIMQARALWNATVTDPQGRIGDDGLQITLYPMDWNVKNLLRPKRGVPVVG